MVFKITFIYLDIIFMKFIDIFIIVYYIYIYIYLINNIIYLNMDHKSNETVTVTNK